MTTAEANPKLAGRQDGLAMPRRDKDLSTPSFDNRPPLGRRLLTQ